MTPLAFGKALVPRRRGKLDQLRFRPEIRPRKVASPCPYRCPSAGGGRLDGAHQAVAPIDVTQVIESHVSA